MKRATVTRSLAALLASSFALAPMVAMAQDEMAEPEPMLPVELSGNVGYFSDYRFRGISQTNEEFAIQGGIDLGLPAGFYVGTWASNVDFGGPETAEVDIYGGWGTELAEGLSLDANAIFFWYPGDESALNYWEFFAGLGYEVGPVGLSGGIVYSPDYFGSLGTGFVFTGGASFALPIPEDAPVSVGLDANVNYTIADDDIITDDDYVDWNIGVGIAMGDSTGLGGLAFDLRYVDTDLPDVDGQDASFVWGASYSF